MFFRCSSVLFLLKHKKRIHYGLDRWFILKIKYLQNVLNYSKTAYNNFLQNRLFLTSKMKRYNTIQVVLSDTKFSVLGHQLVKRYCTPVLKTLLFVTNFTHVLPFNANYLLSMKSRNKYIYVMVVVIHITHHVYFLQRISSKTTKNIISTKALQHICGFYR